MKCNLETFAAITRHASTKVLCMDADLGERTLVVFNKLLNKEDIEVDINLKQRMQRIVQLVNEEDWMAGLKRDLAKGSNVVIASASKTTIQEVEYEPAGHFSHPEIPMTEENVPFGHGRHDEDEFAPESGW